MIKKIVIVLCFVSNIVNSQTLRFFTQGTSCNNFKDNPPWEWRPSHGSPRANSSQTLELKVKDAGFPDFKIKGEGVFIDLSANINLQPGNNYVMTFSYQKPGNGSSTSSQNITFRAYLLKNSLNVQSDISCSESLVPNISNKRGVYISDSALRITHNNTVRSFDVNFTVPSNGYKYLWVYSDLPQGIFGNDSVGSIFLTAIKIGFKGAIDTDGDGIPDSKDSCPTVSGPSSNNGCPIATCSLSAPSNRNATNITTNSAMLSWDTVSNASSYNVQYKKSINSSWISNTTSNSNRTVSNLESNTVYNWRVRSRCSNGAFSSWSVTNNFTTLHGCQNELVITQNVNANQTDNQSAQNSITATNTVNNGAIANYDAGTSVFLKPGFKTNAGAKFKAFIEGCSVVANKVSVNQEKRVLEDETLSTEENSTINNKAFIKLYPNPTEDTFKIESNSTIVKYTVLNQLGKVVINKAVNKSIINVNVQNLTSGIYFVRITLQNGEIIIKKIIKK